MRYILAMFPYPSGKLHMGHVRVYTIADTLARFARRRTGQKIVFPMGFDAFGLPAENAAIAHGRAPREWTYDNIAQMRNQLDAMNTSFDWDRTLATCDASYYRWTQLLFLRLHAHGLAYRKDSTVNWDPVDHTVLANEQVDSEGRAERSGALVEKKELEQWFLRITDFKEELLNDLHQLDWPAKVKTLQANWIGKEDGYEVVCEITSKVSGPEGIKVFFTNKDAATTAEYVAISYDHPVTASDAIPCKYKARVLKTVRDIKSSNLPPLRKSLLGCFTGLTCVNPFTSQALPVYVSGAVPADFAVGATFGGTSLDPKDTAFIETHGITRIVADEKSDVALEGHSATYYRLRDWLISRQRYWGTPIPMIHCRSCGIVPVPESELPVILPENTVLTGKGGSPLVNAEDWINCSCPKCKGPAKRDTDTMDTFLDSSWYWLRYLDPKNETQICDPALPAQHLPVTTYIGGIEHAIMHLLYARFIGKFLCKSGLAPAGGAWNGEPFQRLLAQGMVTGRTIKCRDSGRYLKENELRWKDANTPVIKETGKIAVIGYEKMSKSKYNGVDPSEVIAKYGSDCTRLYILYKAAPADELVWDDAGIVGMQRWLTKVRKVVGNVASADAGASKPHVSDKETLFVLNTAVHEVTTAMTNSYAFHVAIASLIKLTNHLDAAASFDSPSTREAVQKLVTMIAPFAPMAGEQFLQILQTKGSLTSDERQWPSVSLDALKRDTRDCVIMVNGKTRSVMRVPTDAPSSDVELFAWVHEDARRWLYEADGRTRIKFAKVLVMKDGSVVNFILKK
ncbi:hypothetical protein BC830DRAFT_1126397 [Chytriomyces sp. MP71]|nr:hypothetical protein BC830DRAFT_1126397 [Chytriomyces sp. MP71]